MYISILASTHISDFWIHRYFKNPMHIFDAIVVIVTFIFTLLPPGTLEGFGSMTTVLRAWRIFQTAKTTVLDASQIPLLQNPHV